MNELLKPIGCEMALLSQTCMWEGWVPVYKQGKERHSPPDKMSRLADGWRGGGKLRGYPGSHPGSHHESHHGSRGQGRPVACLTAGTLGD